MKLLLDACVSHSARVDLEFSGHDTAQIGISEPDPGDDEILAMAHREDRVLVTLDKDFGELAIVHGRPHAGIVRLVGISAKRQGPICNTIAELSNYLWQSHCRALYQYPSPPDSEFATNRFAELLGVSVRTLQDWEQGRRAPSGAARTLLTIADKDPKVLLHVA